MRSLLLTAAAAALLTGTAAAQETPGAEGAGYDRADPFSWLEDVEGERTLEKVRAWNERSLPVLEAVPAYDDLYDEALAVLTSDARIPAPEIRGEYVYNFWQDEAHVQGLWRRSSIEAYAGGAPEWEILLDVDALREAEGEDWVWHGASCAPASDRCLVSLSHGGSDADVAREFSVETKAFVEGGFVLPEAKQDAAWVDEDTLLVATDWGDGTMTESGYPFVVKRWRRGTPLGEAVPVFEGQPKDVRAAGITVHRGGRTYAFVLRAETFFEDVLFYQGEDGLTKLPIPKRADFEDIVDGKLIVLLREDWSYQGTAYAQGDLVALSLEDMTAEAVFSPNDRQAVQRAAATSDALYVELLDDVAGEAIRLTPGPDGWTAETLALPENGVVSIAAADGDRPDLFLSFESLTQPDTLYHYDAGSGMAEVMALPAFYDASDVVVEQREAESADGTRVPYFVMGKRDVLEAGDAPTIQYGYGGFLIPILPVYYDDPARPQNGALAGKMWVSRGGVLVLSNIRGGGEFGPAWHEAALKENRQRAFDDFIAISEDLIADGVTTPGKLGAIGRSNGGLLMGAMLTQRPDLYAALDIGVPLIDMFRYDKLLAGASWVGEYGDPDIPEERAFIGAYSPYQNLSADADYPVPFIYTSTKDDRVHPGHARKLAAKLESFGDDFLYYENIEGGHGGTANQEQLAMRTALEYAYFVRQLMGQTQEADGSRSD
ncbi:prolyl oligopeptidase family serine peptidase [Parvularcula dongshanensis]|uniref:Prolyl oligopeptidase n=1 Tax=Parvularcula dongshanensis TaxID=1173995 RepID=A0A840I357_9PROT|nr:prolyl oligopeptidase family serine peptidase [Parvularcula dongshanensis]MBB4659279.1 prolyl oligopeptidase [Parvularcula dongshanensis]